MIKLIIFDLSGVIFNCEEPLFFAYFSQHYKVPIEEIDTVYSSLVVQAERGEISLKDLWERLLCHFGLPDNYTAMIEKIMSFRKPNPAMIDLIKTLKKQYKLAYFTNYCSEYWKISEQRWPIAAYFDFGIVSYEIKSRKPDPYGFQLILKKLNVKPEEAVFIDDAAKNLVNAENMGIHVIHFKDPKQCIDALKKLGVVL